MDNLSRGCEKPDCFVIGISFVEKPDGKPRYTSRVDATCGQEADKIYRNI